MPMSQDPHASGAATAKLRNSWWMHHTLSGIMYISNKEVGIMRITFIMIIINLIIFIIFITAVVYLFLLIVRALKKYINSQDVRKEKSETRRSLGEVIKKYRTDNKMTQEFVAESLGVSRQAVSKWEQGSSEPSTSNMIALAKLYGVAPEELLKDVKNV